MHRKQFTPIFGEKTDATLAGKERLPSCGDIGTQWSCGSKACNYYATL
jgi:hypothetical protein